MIEVCLCLYKRKYRIPDIMKQLRNQTFQDFKLNIWNNSNERYIDTRNFSKNRVNIIHSDKNEGSAARFKLASRCRGNPIIFIDDDLSLEKDFIEYYYNQYKKFGSNCILGWFSRTWNGNCDSFKNFLPYGTEVDYLGTGGMILDRKIIDEDLRLQNLPKEFSKTDDMYLCFLARQRGMKLISIDSKCKINYDGNDQHKGLEKDHKKNVFNLLRKEGWKILYDKK